MRDALDGPLRDPTWVGAFLIGTGVMLWAADRFGRRTRALATIGARDSLRIGVAQAVAVLPGVSRSGMCMAAGMLHDVTREGAALFALYLAAPAIGGAGLWAAYQLATDGAEAGVGLGEMALGAAVSFASGGRGHSGAAGAGAGALVAGVRRLLLGGGPGGGRRAGVGACRRDGVRLRRPSVAGAIAEQERRDGRQRRRILREERMPALEEVQLRAGDLIGDRPGVGGRRDAVVATRADRHGHR